MFICQYKWKGIFEKKRELWYKKVPAEVAKLVDAPALGAGRVTPVEVQVLSSAHFYKRL